jgi:short subunit dehydrogenase-like uncharacterized protein
MAGIVLFGATGYTGELTARAMVARGLRPLLAGRSAERLTPLAAELGLDWAVAGATDPAELAALLRPGDVLVSTVGPFIEHGRCAVEAAIARRASAYLDSTGEAAFIRDVFEQWSRPAARAGTALIPACGYDFVPGNLGGGLALEAAPSATSLEIGYFITGGGRPSPGTAASALGASATPHHRFHHGRLVQARSGARRRSFPVGGRLQSALSIGGTEQLALPRQYPQLRDVDVYLGWFGPLTPLVSAGGILLAGMARLPGSATARRRLAAAVQQRASRGPTAAERGRTGSHVLAVATDAGGRRLATVTLTGVDGYTLTAELLAWGAGRALAGKVTGRGALGPAEAFGVAALRRGCAQAGLDARVSRPHGASPDVSVTEHRSSGKLPVTRRH